MALKEGDKVIFNVDGQTLIYVVQVDHLSRAFNFNDAIFEFLGLDKDTFCTKHYGYDADQGDWPVFHDRDYDAATRVVEALAEKVAESGGTTLLNGKPFEKKMFEVKDFCYKTFYGVDTAPSYYTDSSISISTSSFSGTPCVEKPKSSKIFKRMSSIVSKIKLELKSEPEKTLIKAGLMNSDETLTSDGLELRDYFLTELVKEKMHEEGAKILAEKESKK
jgi:hypothetical protein